MTVSEPAFSRCADCSRVWYYDRNVCPKCSGRSFEDVAPQGGTIVAKTVVHVTPDDVPQPLELGLVSFANDVSVIGQLADPELKRGATVVLSGDETLRSGREGTPITGASFHPSDAAEIE